MSTCIRCGQEFSVPWRRLCGLCLRARLEAEEDRADALHRALFDAMYGEGSYDETHKDDESDK